MNKLWACTLVVANFALAESWKCVQGVAPYEDHVTLEVSADAVSVKRGNTECNLIWNGQSRSFVPRPNTCLEMFASAYPREFRWLERVRLDPEQISKTVFFDIGFFDDLGAYRPQSLEYRCR